MNMVFYAGIHSKRQSESHRSIRAVRAARVTCKYEMTLNCIHSPNLTLFQLTWATHILLTWTTQTPQNSGAKIINWIALLPSW